MYRMKQDFIILAGLLYRMKQGILSDSLELGAQLLFMTTILANHNLFVSCPIKQD